MTTDSAEQVQITKQQLIDLVYLAEDSIATGYSEFSNSPDEEDRALMLAMYGLLGKDVPQFFQRTFGWKI